MEPGEFIWREPMKLPKLPHSTPITTFLEGAEAFMARGTMHREPADCQAGMGRAQTWTTTR